MPIPPNVRDESYKKHMATWGVPCHVTGEMIPVPELRYWSVEKQVVYKDAEASLTDHNAQ